MLELEKYSGERHAEYLENETKIAQGTKARIASPETDRHSLVAASGYVMLEADHDRYINALIHHDIDLQDDLLTAGDGLRGRIVGIRDESEGRKTRAIWIVEEDWARPLRLRLGDLIVQAGYPKRKAEIRHIFERPTHPRRFELEIVNGIREGDGPLGHRPLDGRWKRKSVTFLSLGEPGFAYMKRKMLWERDGPGTWLTHKQPWENWSIAGEDDYDTDAVTP